MIVNRGRGLLSTCLAATMNKAKDTEDGCRSDGHTGGEVCDLLSIVLGV